MKIAIVENGRKKGRRKMTAKQKKYFGKRKEKTTTRRKKRNPNLATYKLSNPARRSTSGRRIKRRSNPGGRGIMSMINFGSIFSVTAGILVAKYSSQLVSFVWAAVPTTGYMGTAVKAATVVAAGFASKFVGVSSSNRNAFIAGGLGYCLYELVDTYVAPMIGAPGIAGYVTATDTAYDISQVASPGMGGYVPSSNILDPSIAA